ncbi:hypothetical protein CERZMDRAFT_91927 [Cercospora zeae-maydis SCOH1-5]|uniref:Uncharacterized protein n=1 Tax=Cercospora zeae-maydis SCOH1-5 TaxID=717836 RepID=A0A6A6F0A7_9PEZI|nr:hypothetical protein CERZMDRAFT_91927 [Cercospora zeae-maydis SCOH1-5]
MRIERSQPWAGKAGEAGTTRRPLTRSRVRRCGSYRIPRPRLRNSEHHPRTPASETSLWSKHIAYANAKPSSQHRTLLASNASAVKMQLI